jgi:threonine dehydratase
MYNMQLYFKKEHIQYTGSFKERGARYTLIKLTPDQAAKGVIAASTGNHALAMAYHGQLLSIPVTLVMPITAPIMRVTACRQFGADVVVHGSHMGVSRDHALMLAQGEFHDQADNLQN